MKLVGTWLVVLGLVTLTGCSTVKGVGQDLQKAGSSIEGAVKKN